MHTHLHTRLPWRRPFQIVAAALLGLLTLASAPLRAAEDDPPGRVGRLADLDGPVTMLDAERGEWQPAERNRPLIRGDRLATGPRGRAELRIGSTVLRLAERSEIELARLDDEHLAVRVHRGSLALRLASRETAEETEVLTGEARIAPARAGLYRVDRRLDGDRDRTLVMAWRGTLRIDGGPAVDTGERLQLWRDGARLRQADAAIDDDEFADWVAREDRRDSRQEEQWAQDKQRRVSPEMTGAEELERHGRWESHPEHGWIWLPRDVAADWAPYRDGRWVWLRPWGWTWVDRAPWGFAPFHYGRWVQWRGRWAWWPGEYTVRPVYSPALVGWAGSPSVGVSVHIGSGPGVGWAPLAPRERYRPWYRHSERHAEKVDPWHHLPGPRMTQQPEPMREAARETPRPRPGPERVWPGPQRPMPMPSPATPMPPRMEQQAPAPAPAPLPAAAPKRDERGERGDRGERGGIAERLLERQRDAAPSAPVVDDRKRAPVHRQPERPAERQAEPRGERPADRPGPQR